MKLKKIENPFIKVVIILVIATLILVALMYIMHVLTYKPGETTLWQTTINYVKPKPFYSKIARDSNEMLEDNYYFIDLKDAKREEEQCSGFYQYEKTLSQEDKNIKENYLDHFCLSSDLLIELKEEGSVLGHGIFSLDKKDLFYFITNQHEIIDDSNYSINKLYAYNVETGEYKVLWQELKESLPGEYQFSAYQEYDVVGISASKLVLSKITLTGLGGDYRCFDSLANADEAGMFSFHYLELSDENMEIQDYIIPAENILKAKRWTEECGELLGI